MIKRAVAQAVHAIALADPKKPGEAYAVAHANFGHGREEGVLVLSSTCLKLCRAVEPFVGKNTPADRRACKTVIRMVLAEPSAFDLPLDQQLHHAWNATK